MSPAVLGDVRVHFRFLSQQAMLTPFLAIGNVLRIWLGSRAGWDDHASRKKPIPGA